MKNRSLKKERQAIIRDVEIDIADWVKAQSKRSFYTKQRPRLESALAHLHDKALAEAASAARLISTHEGICGAHALLNGREEGWNQLRASLAYYCWSLRLEHAYVRPMGTLYQVPPGGLLYSLALNCCFAIAVREEDIGRWLAQELLQYYKSGVATEYMENVPFREYVRLLLGTYVNGAWPLEEEMVASLGVYRPLFVESDSAASKQALRDACDFHLAYIGLEGDDELGADLAFSKLPFPIFPVEILAFSVLSERTARAPAEIDHVLMKTPLAHLPSKPFQSDDQLLRQLAARSINVH